MSCKFLRHVLPIFGGLLICSGAYAADLSWDGFGSAFYGQTFSHDILPFGFQNNRPDFTDFSLFGLNVNAKLDDHWSAGAQLVGLGDHTAAANPTGTNNITGALSPVSTFSIQASWAYVSYKTDEGTNFKLGRQRFPIFSASEYIYEHAKLPYRELPAVVFQMAPFVAFDGASISHEFDVGAGKVNVQVFGGTPILAIIPPAGGVTSLTNLVGARINFEGDGWRIRGLAARSSSQSTANNGTVSQADSNYFSGGYRFDKYNIVSWGEYIFRNAPDGTPTPLGTYLGNGKAGYVLGGYRIGAWMPRYTFAQANANLGAIGNGKTTTHTIGVNYQANEKIVVKAEYELTIPGPDGGYKTTPADPTVTGSNGNSVYAGVDFLM